MTEDSVAPCAVATASARRSIEHTDRPPLALSSSLSRTRPPIPKLRTKGHTHHQTTQGAKAGVRARALRKKKSF